MAIDTQNKRRSVTSMIGISTVLPLADGTVGTQDRVHVAFYYSGIAIDALTLATGLISIAYAAKAPGISYASKAPTLTFS